MTIEQATARIAELETQLVPLVVEEHRLWSEYCAAESRWYDYSKRLNVSCAELAKLKNFVELAK